MKCKILFGIRAKFILELLRLYNGGFTLLGDKCQAIYDYQSEEMSSKKFYETFAYIFDNMKEIEYKEQKRLKYSTNEKAILLRNAIESTNSTIIENVVEQVWNSIQEVHMEDLKKGAILTKMNGTVYNISNGLNIEHRILQNKNNIYYEDWVGYIFGDYTNDFIDKYKFQNIIFNKLGIEGSECQKYWNYCKKIEGTENEEIDVKKLHRNLILAYNEVDEITEKNEELVISTIHKAKGKEFENVYIDESVRVLAKNKDLINYAKMLYVAITRAKNKCYKINCESEKNNEYYAKIKGEERYLEWHNKRFNRGKGKTKRSITKIEIGLENDIEKTSFINDRIVGDAVKNIEYIKHEVKKGDYVDLKLENDDYYIYHNQIKIGKMNIGDLYARAQISFNKVSRMTFKPPRYLHVRVKRKQTIAMFQEFIPSEIENVYSKTGIWIGIELEGFGKLDWDK